MLRFKEIPYGFRVLERAWLFPMDTIVSFPFCFLLIITSFWKLADSISSKLHILPCNFLHFIATSFFSFSFSPFPFLLLLGFPKEVKLITQMLRVVIMMQTKGTHSCFRGCRGLVLSELVFRDWKYHQYHMHK